MRARFRHTLVCFGSLCLSACGGGEPPAKSQHDANDHEPEEHTGAVPEVSAEIGALNEDQVTRAFQSSLKGLERCLADGAKRVEFLGGSVAFFLKIDAHGKIAHGHLEKSTLGDWETEKCMLEALRSRDWPAPVGGKVGLARKGFDFDPPNDVRPPTEWDAERVSGSIGHRAQDIKKCKGGAGGQFNATIYVDTNGSVLAVGVTPPDEQGAGAVECLVDVLKRTKFNSPGSWPAKVSVDL
ncbi:MAG: AgmX/PglI C-terminal domain-containing protein [Polyangiaceae bacterium]